MKKILLILVLLFLFFVTLSTVNQAFAYTQIPCSGPTDTSCPTSTEGTVLCKPGWINGASHYTCQLDSGPGSCAGGFTCGTGGACNINCPGAKCDGPGFGDTYACTFCDIAGSGGCSACLNGQQTCKMTTYSGGGSCYPLSKIVSCEAATATPTDTPTVIDPCATATHKGIGCTCTQGTDCSSGYCSLTDSGQKCAAPPASPTPVPVCDAAGTGVVKVTLGSTLGCYPVGSSEHATITCNDGTKTSPFTRCTTLADFTTYAVKFCSTHTTCIYPTPTATPSNTPTPTNTPTPIPPLKCDPNGDNNIDERDFQIWKDEFTSGIGNKSACFAPDTSKVDILDFQVWKDINFGLRSKF